MQREACIACKPYVILRPWKLGKALLTGFLALLGISGAAAERCENPDYRAFDFWLGAWVVELADGRPAGTNRIEASKDGCVLHEHWTGASGGEGYSINFYDPGKDLWR